MTSYETVFKRGFAPGLSDAQLESLRSALAADDPRVIQGATTTPPPLRAVQDWPVQATCPITWTGWQGGQNPDCTTVGAAEEHFARLCFEADRRLGEEAACRWYLNAVDDLPRDEIWAETIRMIDDVLRDRRRAEAAAAPAFAPAS